MQSMGACNIAATLAFEHCSDSRFEQCSDTRLNGPTCDRVPLEQCSDTRLTSCIMHRLTAISDLGTNIQIKHYSVGGCRLVQNPPPKPLSLELRCASGSKSPPHLTPPHRPHQTPPHPNPPGSKPPTKPHPTPPHRWMLCACFDKVLAQTPSKTDRIKHQSMPQNHKKC